MADQDGQFDEFDNLVDDTATDEHFPSEDTGDAGRKKRQNMFYLVLVVLIVLGGASAWFVFFNNTAAKPPASHRSPTPPMPIAAVHHDNALPPGVSADQTKKPGDTASINPAGTPEDANKPGSIGSAAGAPPLPMAGGPNAAVLPPIPAPGDTKPDAASPASSASGTAEALPPPALPGSEPNAMTPPPIPTPDAAMSAPGDKTAQPALPASPDKTAAATPSGAPALPEPAASSASGAPIAAAMPEQQAAALPSATGNIAPVTATSSSVTDPAANERVSQLEDQVKTLTAGLAAVKSVPASGNAANPALHDAVEQLTQKLDQLTQQVNALDQRTTTLATELQNRPSGESTKPAAPAQQLKAEDASVALEPAKEEPVKAAAPKPHTVKKKTAPVKKHSAEKASAAGGWELRSAQPGVAWLGKSGSSDMSRFAVGEAIPGLGNVQTVTEEDGHWIVRTTGGTIHE